MSRPSGAWGWRWLVAHHEAGHAVAAVLMGWPIRYATLAPRAPGLAGRVVWAPGAWRVTRSGRWEPQLVATAAGMAAEDLLQGRDAARRGAIVRRNRAHDLKALQVGCRHVWHRIHHPDNYAGSEQPSPPVEPAWTVADIAGRAWRRAAELVWDQWPVVCQVADALLSSPRALTGAEVGRIADATAALLQAADAEDGRDPADGLTGSDLEFWPAWHSRLAWRPFPQPAAAAAWPDEDQRPVPARLQGEGMAR